MIVADVELVRAREEPAFRRQLVATSLELLLRELNRLRRSTGNTTQARQLREGVDLAVRLAELLQRIGGMPPAARARRDYRNGSTMDPFIACGAT